MTKRRLKKAYRKMMEGEILRSKESNAIWNGKGDFTRKLVKLFSMEHKEWYQEMTKEIK